MALYVTRTYKNAAAVTLRVDTIIWTATTDTFNRGTALSSYGRRVNTVKTLKSDIVDRVVASIQIETDADIIDTSGNYLYVRWTRNNGTVEGDMSDLPIITDTV